MTDEIELSVQQAVTNIETKQDFDLTKYSIPTRVKVFQRLSVENKIAILKYMPFNLPSALEILLQQGWFGQEQIKVIDCMLHNIENKEQVTYMHEKIYWRFLETLFK